MVKADKIINFESYPVSVVLKMLLKDMTTGKNIIFATSSYSKISPGVTEQTQITEALIKNLGDRYVQSRSTKSIEQQSERTRKKAEVFTPAWICNKMNNHCDEEWFGRRNVFNIERNQDWDVIAEPVYFEKPDDWKKYVDSKRLEITCGEAPYIVSRYDASTGHEIDVIRRIGILDRKLRVINENTSSEKEWMKWVMRAYQSVYGYEFQGDNLLIARINLLISFVDYMQERWDREPTNGELKKIASIIVWNFWQMDGITGAVPFGKTKDEYKKLSSMSYIVSGSNVRKEDVDCKIYDWKKKESLTYKSLKEGRDIADEV